MVPGYFIALGYNISMIRPRKRAFLVCHRYKAMTSGNLTHACQSRGNEQTYVLWHIV